MALMAAIVFGAVPPTAQWHRVNWSARRSHNWRWQRLRPWLMGMRPRTNALLVCAAASAARGQAQIAKGRKRRKSLVDRPTLAEVRGKLEELGFPTSGQKEDLLQAMTALRKIIREADESIEPTVLEETDEQRKKRLEAKRLLQSIEEVNPGIHAAPEEKPCNSGPTADSYDVIRPGDNVRLRMHTGSILDVRGDDVWVQNDADAGEGQALVIEKSPLVVEKTDPSCFHSGDLAFFRAQNGCHLDLHCHKCHWRARWHDYGAWQSIELTKKEDGVLRAGDEVFLRTHTGAYIDVESDSVRARWEDQGEWQRFTIEKANGDRWMR